MAGYVNPELLQVLRSGIFVGKPVTDFLRSLCVHCPNITELNFRTYSPGANLADRLSARKVVLECFPRADQIALDTGITLWEALARSVIRDGQQLPREVFIEAIGHHHSEVERTIILTRQNVSDSGIDSTCNGLEDADGLAVCSGARLRAGYTAHLPMLDFACPPTGPNLAAIATMLEVIGQTGVIVNSGNSYHFFGMSLLTTDQWIRFMGQSLLLGPFVDTRFIGHRLLDGECTLRVFARSKRPQVPVVEKCVH